jgi:hypothetical protein
MRNIKRVEAESVYSSDSMVIVQKDNQPVYMVSNCGCTQLASASSTAARTSSACPPLAPHE